MDGIRAFWDGSQLFSKMGTVLPVPSEFIRSLPHDVCLDGELWIGYDAFPQLMSVLRTYRMENRWQHVQYCVFDAPMHPGNYVERHTFLRDTISGYPNHITLIPVIHCMGLKHLHTVLKEITKKKGEGIMLYHPEAKYTPGRTDHLYKVKAYSEEDVKFKKYNPNTYSFLCEQYAIG
uniref:ATP-dependent DNA ligase family profile domain-containing protein n=1 Tax=Arcella intermedia TaxID=1963864 RepID=A0A6B2LKS4_9EUKA